MELGSVLQWEKFNDQRCIPRSWTPRRCLATKRARFGAKDSGPEPAAGSPVVDFVSSSPLSYSPFAPNKDRYQHANASAGRNRCGFRPSSSCRCKSSGGGTSGDGRVARQVQSPPRPAIAEASLQNLLDTLRRSSAQLPFASRPTHLSTSSTRPRVARAFAPSLHCLRV